MIRRNAPACAGGGTVRTVVIARSLVGIARVGTKIALSDLQREQGTSAEAYLQQVVEAASALARHVVLDCLRSSRVALLEHVLGGEDARARVAPTIPGNVKKSGKSVMRALDDVAGHRPEWCLTEASRSAAPPWLVDADEHRRVCDEEKSRYREIADLAERLSDAREQAKCEHLAKLCAENRKVIAFDSHTLTLHLFKTMLGARNVRVHVLTGDDGPEGKRRAVNMLGLDSDDESFVVLCSDALSEGLNLQKSSVVVHLDFPTVIREAEQRVGRVDRIDSPHDEIHVWFADAAGPTAGAAWSALKDSVRQTRLGLLRGPAA